MLFLRAMGPCQPCLVLPVIFRPVCAAFDLIRAMKFTLKALLVRALLQRHPVTRPGSARLTRFGFILARSTARCYVIEPTLPLPIPASRRGCGLVLGDSSREFSCARSRM
ncbi:hypothetical protein B0I37DRAFT_375362 [Chaetomium sp. MPI-CAGE-AT-0009]|nr:hypothetical protein B0I37DRAFT_375362 [Chaetomium sp. MPI-CAGE-AT-0009]